MAMSGSALSAEIKTAIKAIPGINITSDAELKAFTDAIGGAIVSYIQANAKAKIPASSIITTGSPASQTGPQSDLSLEIS